MINALKYKLLDRRTRLGRRLILAVTPSMALVLLFSVFLFPGVGLKVLAMIFAAVGLFLFLRGFSSLATEIWFRIRLFAIRRRNRIR